MDNNFCKLLIDQLHDKKFNLDDKDKFLEKYKKKKKKFQFYIYEWNGICN